MRTRVAVNIDSLQYTFNIELLGITSCNMPSAELIPCLAAWSITNTYSPSYLMHVVLQLNCTLANMPLCTTQSPLAGLHELLRAHSEGLSAPAMHDPTQGTSNTVPEHTKASCPVTREEAAFLNRLLFSERAHSCMPNVLSHHYANDGYVIRGIDSISCGVIKRIRSAEIDYKDPITIKLQLQRYESTLPIFVMNASLPQDISTQIKCHEQVQKLRDSASERQAPCESMQLALVSRDSTGIRAKIQQLWRDLLTTTKTSKVGLLLPTSFKRNRVDKSASSRRKLNLAKANPY